MDRTCSLVMRLALLFFHRTGRLTWRNTKISVAFLGLRIAHTILYIEIENRRLSHSRSLVWMASVACCLTLLFMAGNVLVDGKRIVL